MVFLDELTELLTDWLISYMNVIIYGDFNLHINNPSDKEAQSFIDTMEAFGLKQHVSYQTHHDGNILDLIFTETIRQFNIRTFKAGLYLTIEQ